MVGMGRLVFRVFTLLAVVSLVVCAAVVVLWVRSGRRGGDAGGVYLSWAGARYAAQSGDGVITVRGPPPPVASAAGPASAQDSLANTAARGIRNDQIAWQV